MPYVVTADPKQLAKQLFKAGQQPAAWLRSAGRLRDAAEAILKHELPAERAYSQAREIADEEARAESVRNDTGVGVADIRRKLYAMIGVELYGYPPNPWAAVGMWASIALGIPLVVLVLGSSLVWAFSGFAAKRP
jgi:hypothetical protein